MIPLAIASSGFLVAIVVLIVERTNARERERLAYREGFFKGYQAATTFQRTLAE